MLRDALPLKLYVAALLVVAQAAASQTSPPQLPPQTATPTAAQNVTPPKPTVEPTPDPASAHFLTTAGLLLVAIKPTAVEDYELVIRALQEALSKDTDALRVAAAKGWRVYKSDNDAKGNQLYVHVLSPTVTGFDYRPSLLLDELLKELAPELLSKYQEAFAVPPTKLNLTEFANMSVAPLPLPPPPETKKPPGR